MRDDEGTQKDCRRSSPEKEMEREGDRVKGRKEKERRAGYEGHVGGPYLGLPNLYIFF